jgi:hypothetical protein
MAVRPYVSASRLAAFAARRRLLLDSLFSLGLLGLATAGFFWQILFAGAWMPAGGGDLAALMYPTYHFAAQSLQSGSLPLWNPYLYSGAPFAADIQASLFYPLNLVYFLLAPQVTFRSVMLLAVLHIWLAGAGMYLFLHSLLLGRRVLAPLLGGLAFMFSDYFVVHFGNLNLIAQAAWLPFIFLFFHRSLRERRPGLAVWAGVCLAVAATAGHIQPLLIITLGLAWDVLYHLGVTYVRSKVERKPLPGASRVQGASVLGAYGAPVATFLITLLVGLGLAAVVLVPAYEMTAYTLRADFEYGQASAYSLPPAQLVGLLVPGFFGRDPASHWGIWDRVEVGYAGVLTLVLALFALLAYGRGEGEAGPPGDEAIEQPVGETWSRRHAARSEGYRFASLALFSLLLAMGGYTALHGWLYGLVPGFGGMRAPARSVFLMDFALAALAALGLHALLRGPDEWILPALRRLLRVAPWVIGALLLFAMPLAYYAVLTNQDKDAIIFARTSAAANGLVFFIGLLIACVGVLFVRQRRVLRPAAVGVLAVGLLFFDLVSLGGNVDVGYQDPTRNFDHPAVIQFLKSDPSLYRIDARTDVGQAWQPNTGLLHGIFDVSGLVNPLSLADYDRYWNGIPSRSSPLYDFLNAKYLIASKEVVLDWEKYAPVFDADPALNVYLNRRALPRALVVHRAIAVPDHEAAFRALHVPGFDPAASVVIEGGKSLDVTPLAPATISFEAFNTNEIQLQVDTSTDGYLVLSEVWYPGWQATVDGRPGPVLRANYAFRAVRLPPGKHQVRLTFAPRSWRIGLTISGLTALVLIGWAILRLFRIIPFGLSRLARTRRLASSSGSQLDPRQSGPRP